MLSFKNPPHGSQGHASSTSSPSSSTKSKHRSTSDLLSHDILGQGQEQQQQQQRHPRRPSLPLDSISNYNSSIRSSNSLLSLCSIDSTPCSFHDKDKDREKDALSIHNIFRSPETKRDRKNSTSSRAKNAISALSKRFSPPPPPPPLRSLSSNASFSSGMLQQPLPDLPTAATATPTTAASTTTTMAPGRSPSPSSSNPRTGTGTDTSMSLSGGGRSLSLPSPGSCAKDHLRHHTVLAVPTADPRAAVRSSCASSCSASSSASSSPSLSSSTSSSSSAFFSPTTFYSSLFGHSNFSSTDPSALFSQSHSSAGLATSVHTVSSASFSTGNTSTLPATTSNNNPASAMGMTRQSRSASCTPSFSLSALTLDSSSGSWRISDTEPLSSTPVEYRSHSSMATGHVSQRSYSVSSASGAPSNAASTLSSPTSPATTLPPLPHFAPLPLTANFSTDDYQALSVDVPPLGPLSIAVPHRDRSGTGGMASAGPTFHGWQQQVALGRTPMQPTSPLSTSSASDSGFLGGSRRSSKDSCESAPGVTLDNLVNQLTIPDYVNSIEQIAKTKVFLMIYRKFLRPRELLDMLIERFEELGEFIDDEDEEANNTRLRICAILMAWLKHHPNDLIHRQTRQHLARFLRDRVALFPCLNEIYVQLVPLSSIHHFNNWRWPLGDSNSDSRNSSISGPTGVGAIWDEDTDSGFHDTLAFATEADMDEDREWGLFDEDDAMPEVKPTPMSFDSLAPCPQLNSGSISSSSSPSPLRLQTRVSLQPLPRDRRSSTGSLAHTSPCAMEAFVSNRRGSASSVSSGPAAITSTPAPSTFTEGDPTPHQLQPMTPIPFINKRSSSQAYRKRSFGQQGAPLPGPMPNGSPAISQGTSNTSLNATLIFRETADDAPVHPLQGSGANSIHHQPPPIDYLSMNTPFMDIKDGAIAAQLTSVEFLLFKKLRPRDMLRQVWKTKKGSAAFQACISHFNFISSWVGTMILSPAKVKSRAKMMEKFINIAKLLRDMGNFNTTMAIIGAMNTSSIHRLVQTRELLQGKEIWATFKELEHLMSSERSFFEYRAALKAQPQPCIPYLGVHLGDLLSISEGNRDFRQDGTIHWQKFCLLTEVISTVIQFQSKPYDIQPDPFISRVITDTHVLDDEELYTKSVGTEPGKLHHSRSLSKFNFF